LSIWLSCPGVFVVILFLLSSRPSYHSVSFVITPHLSSYAICNRATMIILPRLSSCPSWLHLSSCPSWLHPSSCPSWLHFSSCASWPWLSSCLCVDDAFDDENVQVPTLVGVPSTKSILFTVRCPCDVLAVVTQPDDTLILSAFTKSTKPIS